MKLPRFPFRLYPHMSSLDRLAYMAGIGGLVTGLLGYMLLAAVVMVLAGMELPEDRQSPAVAMLALANVAAMFGSAWVGMLWFSRSVYRRYARRCPSCGKQPLSFRKNQERDRTCRCPYCHELIPGMPSNPDEIASPSHPRQG